MKQIILTLFIIALDYVQCQKHEEVFAWKNVQYAWPDEKVLNDAVKNKEYIAENNVPLGLERWNDKLFITVPRWKPGTASTVNYVNISEIGHNKEPLLIPYPNWESNLLPKSKENISEQVVINAIRLYVDECDRLWILDKGDDDVITHIMDEPLQYVSPGIVIYDLKTNKFIRRHNFKKDDLRPYSFVTNIIVDVDKDKCDNAFAYIADTNRWGLLVYDFAKDESWRVNHNYFSFEPIYTDFTIAGVNFQWIDGILGITFGPRQEDGYRKLYFHATTSHKGYVVSTEILQNKTAALSKHNFFDFKYIGERGKDSQSTAIVYDQGSGVIFYTQVIRNGVACWDTKKPMTPENFHLLVSDNETMIYLNEVKIDSEGYLWFISNRMPTFLYSHLDLNDINVRVFRAKIKDLLEECLK